MIAEERYKTILALLKQNDLVTISELCEKCVTTAETIRRDLGVLEKNNKLKKVHGGAVSVDSEDIRLESFRVRYMDNIESKQTIASLIAPLIQDQETVMLDASTSSFYLADTIKHLEKIVFITNSLKILEMLSTSKSKVIALGGEMSYEELAFVGSQTLTALDKFYANHCFISCHGIDMELGIMDVSPEEAVIKEKMLTQSSKRYLLVDYSKFGKKGSVKIDNFQNIDYIVTDSKPSDEWVAFFRDREVELLYN